MENIFLPLLDQTKLILFVGIGNRLKSDDAIGIYICEEIKQVGRKQVLIVESGIEKYVGKINTLSPDILVLVDCTDFNREPGFFNLFPVDETRDNTLHTHTISLLRISEFFMMKTFILGIQPQFTGFGEEISPIVIQRAKQILTFLNEMA
ncbi:MAG: hydrogenase maturation protease [Candidatus Cloacimonadaceae bacterium]|nr:hydrogenase maturation protease [Candidatus Cloacimonadaceae bacterium]MDP3113426.1 hydrogenase maturation protease [Candidatus Cloacimonadaceae bacterium]